MVYVPFSSVIQTLQPGYISHEVVFCYGIHGGHPSGLSGGKAIDNTEDVVQQEISGHSGEFAPASYSPHEAPQELWQAWFKYRYGQKKNIPVHNLAVDLWFSFPSSLLLLLFPLPTLQQTIPDYFIADVVHFKREMQLNETP